MATILIYSPDETLARRLCETLKKEKCFARHCDEKSVFSQELTAEQPPLILLDARLKWTTCRPLFQEFQKHNCPILFITADAEMSTHLRALYAGPSEVLTLPISVKALLAKISVLIGDRRPLRELSLDEKERVAMLDGRRVELTAQEFALLLALMEKPDMPVSREQLLRKAWGYQSMGETRTVDVHVQRLRKKLGGDYIETVYKCGYRLKLA
ncbi:MAG: response regulator transcription factor [Clostridiales bacterium]|nr:response regulator transcription factor [Clostridiales bacterium]